MPALDAYLGLPDPTVRLPNPANSRAVAALVEWQRRNPPGQWTDNRLEQVQHLKGVSYLAIQAKAEGISGSTLRVLTRRRKKAMPTPHGQAEDADWVPAPRSHPLCELFERVNDRDTLPDVLAQWVTQRDLTGSSLLYVRQTKGGDPHDLWPLKTALCQAQPISPQWPCGAWLAMNWSVGATSGFASPVSAVFDSRDVLRHVYTHPLWPWDGYSPLTAGGVQLDILEAIDQARKNAMDHGWSPDVFVTVDGASDDEIQRVTQVIRQNNSGSANHRNAFVANGEQIKVQALNTAPKDMDFGAGWDQMVKFCLALFGVPPAIAGIAEATSYAQLYASLRQFHTLCLRPSAKQIGDFLTKHLARRWYGPDFRVQLDLPTLDDPDLLERQLAADAGIRTVNERRALRGLSPWPDGDVPEQEYAAKRQQALQPKPDPAGNPLAALMGGGESGPPKPENKLAEDSLPPKDVVKKSLRRMLQAL